MKIHLRRIALASLLLVSAVANAQQPKTPASSATPAITEPSKIQKDIAAYLRHVYAFGPEVELVVGPLHEVGTSGILETIISLTVSGNHEDAPMYVTKDAPATGAANAPITLVEFSDFQCPVCKALHDALRDMLPGFPQVKVVFKQFPLE